MRKILFFVLFITNVSYAQINEFRISSDGNIDIEEIVELNVPKDVLYQNAQEWIVQTFGDYKSVIQFEDKENFKLIMKGFTPIEHVWYNNLGGKTKEEMSYTIAIECKDGKYRYKISDILVEQKFSILGVPGSVSISPNDHLEKIESNTKFIEEYECKLDSIKSIRTEKMKKKELKKINEDIENIQKSLNNALSMRASEQTFYKQELDAINSLIISLKGKMKEYDNW